MAHHGNDSYALRELLDFAEAGPTGRFPRGKLNENDEGEIQIAIAVDKAKQVVIIDFGKPTTWIGFTADQASDLADLILKKSWELRGITS